MTDGKNYKKIYFSFLGMLLVVFCCSCHRGQQEERVSEMKASEKLMSDMAVISVDGEFYNIIANSDKKVMKEFIQKSVLSKGSYIDNDFGEIVSLDEMQGEWEDYIR